MFKTDLHLHTCLSPCAELEMSPRKIVNRAIETGMDIIGICDHNSCENVSAVRKCAQKTGLTVIRGIEVTSREEVHILALFDDDENMLYMQKIVYDNLSGENNEKLYGEQVVVNEFDEVVEFNRKLLIGATNLSVDDIVEKIHELNGLAIASHIDRQSFSIIGQLGFIPTNVKLDAVEVIATPKVYEYENLLLPVIISSDAHRLDEIGQRFTQFYLKEPSFLEIKKSFLGEEGRRVVL
ncbi:MAG: PHP domain-containing protein [Candidatus Hydrogenedentota bacterium]